MNLESGLQRDIVVALRRAGHWVIRTGVTMKRGAGGTRGGEPGMPDLCLPSLGWLEVKLPGKPLSVHQELWHSRARRSGVNVATARSVGEAVGFAEQWRKGKAA